MAGRWWQPRVQTARSEELRELAKKYLKLKVHQLDVADEKSIQDLADKLDGKPIDVLHP